LSSLTAAAAAAAAAEAGRRRCWHQPFFYLAIYRQNAK